MSTNKKIYYSLLLFGLCLAASFIHPYHIHPYRTFYHDGFAILGLILGFSMLGDESGPRLRVPRLVFIPVGLIMIIFLQLLLNLIDYPWELVLPIAYLLLAACAMIYGASIAGEEGGGEKLCFCLAYVHLTAGLLSVVMQNSQFWGIDLSPVVMQIARGAQSLVRPYANVAQPNLLALLMCMAIASIWWLYQQRRLSSIVATMLTICLLWGLALTQSRIGWLIVPAFCVFVAWRQSGLRRIAKRCFVLLMAIYVSFVVLVPFLSASMGLGAASIAEHVGGRSERTILILQALQISLQHPWLGVGWFGFGPAQVGVAADFSSTTYAEHAHNFVMNLAAEIGWPFTLAICCTLLAWGYAIFRQPKKSVCTRFASLMIIAVVIHSMVEFPLWYAFVLLPFASLLGMVHQLHWPAAAVTISRAKISVGVALALIAGLVVTWDYRRVESGFRTLRWVQEGYDVDKSPMSAPTFTLFPYFFEYFKFMQIEPHEGMSAEEITFVEYISKRYGFVHVLNTLAETYVLNGQRNQALHVMITLQRLHPIAYPEYFDYWKAKAALSEDTYGFVFQKMPKRDAK